MRPSRPVPININGLNLQVRSWSLPGDKALGVNKPHIYFNTAAEGYTYYFAGKRAQYTYTTLHALGQYDRIWKELK